MLRHSFVKRGTHTLSFAHSAPLRAEDFFCYGGPKWAPARRALVSYVTSTYLFGIKDNKRDRFIHSFELA
jgi:hypothetical protein